MNNENNIYLGRQAILDRHNEVYAYEILFRSSNENKANFTSNVEATSTVMHYAFSAIGLDKTLGDTFGLINIDERMLHDDIITLLPSDKIGIELLGPIKNENATLARIKKLKKQGFKISWDNLTTMEEVRAFLPYLDFVKIECAHIQPKELITVVKTLKLYPHIKITAKKVENKIFADMLFNLGFDLFQGFYYSKPEILETQQITPSDDVIAKILHLVDNNATTKQIIDTLKESMSLCISLLLLVNSIALKKDEPIYSLIQAVDTLGKEHLKRWLQIFLLSSSKKQHPELDNLLKLAISRGIFIERMAKSVGGNEADQAAGYMTGMLSLVDVIMGIPLEQLLKKLPLDEVVIEALTERKNILGQFLNVVERMENDDDITLTPELTALFPELTEQLLAKIQSDSLRWANKVAKE